MRKRNPVLPSPGQFKKHGPSPHTPLLFLFKRETAQGQGLTGAGTPRDEFLWGFIFVLSVFFSSTLGLRRGGEFTVPPPRTALSFCPRGRGVFPTLPLFSVIFV